MRLKLERAGRNKSARRLAVAATIDVKGQPALLARRLAGHGMT
jgi:hypothetical protein